MESSGGDPVGETADIRSDAVPPEETPDAAADLPREQAPEAAPDLPPEPTLDATPEPEPEAALEPPPEEAPDAAAEPPPAETPDAAADLPPATTPEPTPEPPPATTPEPTPEPPRQTTPAAPDVPPETWGRIDAEGTVFVRTGDGEREIGSWQAGDVEAGLAFYHRRFEDLETEVDLLEKRLASGAGDPGATRTAAKHLKEQVPEAAAIGDLAALDSRLDALLAACAERASERAAAREQARAEAVAAKEALITEAEQIAESGTSWKTSGDRLRAIVDEWKQIRGIDRRTDDALWKRFAAARDAFGKRRGQHFAQLDAERGTAKVAKEQLVARALELSTSSDWRDTAAAMRDLMTEWKAAPRASRDVENDLWTQFRAAQDAFFERRSATFASRDAEQFENQKKKEEIITSAESLDVSDPKAAQALLRDLQAKFDQIGHVPRDAIRRIDDRMRAAEQRVRDAVDAGWRAATVESNPFLAELRARLVEAEEKLARARKSGDEARIAKAEADVASRRSLLPDS